MNGYQTEKIPEFITDFSETSWQERYLASEIFTLKCRILDKPGMLGK